MKANPVNVSSLLLVLFLLLAVFSSRVSFAEKSPLKEQNILSGYYTREGNDGKMAKASGHNEYVKFYPGKRIIRLYVPYPYSKTVKSDVINRAFSMAIKETSGSAYIKSKFGVMDKPVIAYLDFYHWVNDQVMYDCGKPMPCKVTFDDKSMTVLKPGIVLGHKIHYGRVND